MKTHKDYRSSLKQLGKTIKYYRNLNDLKPKEMADKLTVQTNSYYKIERGESDLCYTSLLHIAEILKVDMKVLITT